ncbi:MAG: BCD family MFS transporter [Chloroflexaceae bacterium]|nr:BCD family MFS transporter [Chloroflexaceae bacterium]NJO83787.1 BCD family MFS transporter [Blastochloris sp.]
MRYWLSIVRLGLFQFGMGLSLAPLTGTLNRVLIDELSIPAVAVGFLIAIHYFVSPVRALIGHHSDQSRASGSWRTPYVVFGAMLTYGGLACAPFSLLLLMGDGIVGFWPAMIICTLIFLVYGIGVNIVETVFLALVSDITPPGERGRVLAILWIMLLLGTVVSSFIIGSLLHTYSHIRLIQVMQGSAVVFVVLAMLALWGRERLRPDGQIDAPLEAVRVRLSLGESIALLWGQKTLRNLFVVLFVATTGFATHDVLLEPYGGQVLNMSVAETTRLTALWGTAMLIAISGAGALLWRGRSAVMLIMSGCAVGASGFLAISIASDAALVSPFLGGVWLIGMGRGLFIVGSLALVMSLTDIGHAGLFIGLWGVMQAIAQGCGTIGGGLLRDVAQHQTGSIVLGYTSVYSSSLALLVLSLVLVVALRLGRTLREQTDRSPWAGLQDIPADQIVY